MTQLRRSSQTVKRVSQRERGRENNKKIIDNFITFSSAHDAFSLDV